MLNILNRILANTGINYRIEKEINPKKNLRSLVYRNSIQLTTNYLEDDIASIFFGYHDKTPFNKSNSKILANLVKADGSKHESESTPMDVGFYEWKSDTAAINQFHKISETTTWSWQQGCMLQWNPKKPDREAIFNKMIDGAYGAVITDIETGREINIFNKPIYCVDPTGKYGASLNFSRLGRIRKGYGYRNLVDKSVNSKTTKEDGIYLVNLMSGKIELIIDLDELAELTIKEKDHYINHISFSPDGKYITFFHYYGDVQIKRMNRFYLYEIEKKRLTLLEAFRTVSHYCWRSKYEIITTENGPGGCHYFLYNLNLKTKTRIDIPNIGDFHPMIHPVDPDIIVADSKPDRKRNQHLFLFNIITGEYKCIGSFFSPKRYSHGVRCDLHPRWDRKGEAVIVDTTCRGKRSLAVLDIPSDIWI